MGNSISDMKNCMTNGTFIVMGFLYLLAAIIVISLGLTSTSNALYIVAIVLLVLGIFFIIIGVAFCCFNRPATEAFACGNCSGEDLCNCCQPSIKEKRPHTQKIKKQPNQKMMHQTKQHKQQHTLDPYYHGESDEYTMSKRPPFGADQRRKGSSGMNEQPCCDHSSSDHSHFHHQRGGDSDKSPLMRKHEQLHSELEHLDDFVRGDSVGTGAGDGAGDWSYNPGYQDRDSHQHRSKERSGPPEVPRNTTVHMNPLHRSASASTPHDYGRSHHEQQQQFYRTNGTDEDGCYRFPVDGTGHNQFSNPRDDHSPHGFQDHYEKDGRLTPRSQKRRQVQFSNQQLVFGGKENSAFSRPHPRAAHAFQMHKVESQMDRYPRDDVLNPVPTGIQAMDGFPGSELPIPIVRAPSRQSLLEPTNFSGYSPREPETYRGTPEPEGIPSPYGSLRRLAGSRSSMGASQRSLTPGSVQRGLTPTRPPAWSEGRQDNHQQYSMSRDEGLGYMGGSPHNGYADSAMTRSYQEYSNVDSKSTRRQQQQHEHLEPPSRHQNWSSSTATTQNVVQKLEPSAAPPEYRITSAYDRSLEDEYHRDTGATHTHNSYRGSSSVSSNRAEYGRVGGVSSSAARQGYGPSSASASSLHRSEYGSRSNYGTKQQQESSGGQRTAPGSSWHNRSDTPNRDQRATTPSLPRARFPNVPWQTPFDEVRAAPPVPPVVNPLLEKVSRSRESSVAAPQAYGDQSTGSLKAIYP